ncbi:DUF2752 domain-containing protein [Serinibacter salmoneus]|uniref:Uncharacterized protein DUF2752 n=1 Tax=Serinibacter salmoneus TaxID=556530 RepID=A0A2A9D1M8_9MICO|nr:DUF2752 domain-containing protein [Serinibacter salmoneus]PFG19759.1 uncharacterized protein DUF2752 [Serinibacter salmoneus]
MTRGAPSAHGRAARAQAWSFGALLAGGVALVVLAAPSEHHYVTCPSLLIGLVCPGCGGLRAVDSLLHGDLATAWAYNPLVVVGLVAVAAAVIRWALDARAGREPWEPPAGAVVTLGVAVIGFWVLRNVPLLVPYLGPLAQPAAG